jgi:hypothetical protein
VGRRGTTRRAILFSYFNGIICSASTGFKNTPSTVGG